MALFGGFGHSLFPRKRDATASSSDSASKRRRLQEVAAEVPSAPIPVSISASNSDDDDHRSSLSVSPTSFAADIRNIPSSSPPSLEAAGATVSFETELSSSPTDDDGGVEGANADHNMPQERPNNDASDLHHPPSPDDERRAESAANSAVDHACASECYAAISAARRRLAAARRHAAASRDNLSRARAQLRSSELDVRDAADYLRGAERRWGVIDVDEDSPHGNDRGVSGGAALPDRSTAADPAPQSANVENDVKRVHVSNAGEQIVNGTYTLQEVPLALEGGECGHATYVHEAGPFTIRNERYDACLFPRFGYGDKARWCIGLVPVSRAGLDLARAYIYYWIETGGADGNVRSPPLSMGRSSSSSSWGVCHGVRPLPCLEDLTGANSNEGQWWQFWKRGDLKTDW